MGYGNGKGDSERDRKNREVENGGNRVTEADRWTERKPAQPAYIFGCRGDQASEDNPRNQIEKEQEVSWIPLFG